jgi:hypothetical protein
MPLSARQGDASASPDINAFVLNYGTATDIVGKQPSYHPRTLTTSPRVIKVANSFARP